MRKITKRSAAITAATVIAIGGGAAAWATVNGWNVTGTGTGDATAASITPLTASADLGLVTVYPGLDTTVVTQIANPNDFPVRLTDTNVAPTGVTVTGGTAPSDHADCQNTLTTSPAMLTANFPGGPVVPKKSPGTGVSTHLVIGDIPQTCAGTHIKVTYSFTAVGTA